MRTTVVVPLICAGASPPDGAEVPQQDKRDGAGSIAEKLRDIEVDILQEEVNVLERLRKVAPRTSFTQELVCSTSEFMKS